MISFTYLLFLDNQIYFEKIQDFICWSPHVLLNHPGAQRWYGAGGGRGALGDVWGAWLHPNLLSPPLLCTAVVTLPPSSPVCFAVSPLHTMFLLPPSLSAGHLHHRGSACKLYTRILIIYGEITLPIYHRSQVRICDIRGVTGASIETFSITCAHL